MRGSRVRVSGLGFRVWVIRRGDQDARQVDSLQLVSRAQDVLPDLGFRV